MRAVRHFIVLVVGIVVLALVTHVGSALWVATAILGSYGVNRLASVVAAADRRKPMRNPVLWIGLFTFGGLVLAVAALVAVFLAFGWIAAVGMVVVYLLFVGTREADHVAEARQVAAIRGSLLRDIAEWSAGRLADEQLTRRSDLALAELPRLAYSLRPVYSPLITSGGIGTGQHRKLLEVLAGYLAQVDKDPPYCRLHDAIRAELAAAPGA